MPAAVIQTILNLRNYAATRTMMTRSGYVQRMTFDGRVTLAVIIPRAIKKHRVD